MLAQENENEEFELVPPSVHRSPNRRRAFALLDLAEARTVSAG